MSVQFHRWKRSRYSFCGVGLLAAVLFCPCAARSQELKFDTATNFSYLRATSTGAGGSFNNYGASASVAWNLKPWLGVISDLGVYQFTGQPAGVSGRLVTSAGGARYIYHPLWTRWVPFGQAMVGGVRLSGDQSGQRSGENGLAILAGGGVDAKLSPRFSIRCVEADYVMMRLNRANNTPGYHNDIRVSAGIVFHFDLNPKVSPK